MKFYCHEFRAMGSPCEIRLYAADMATAERIVHFVVADLQRLEARYSRYRNDSLLAEINRVAANGGQIKVDAETASLLHYATTCYEQSEGLFDITSGVLRNLWCFDREKLPAQEQISEILHNIGWHKVLWHAPWLEFPVAGMELDLGGIVKEYAADRAAGLCWQEDIRHGIVSLGGDIRIIGPHPDGSPWRIGIQHPRHKNELLYALSLSQGALASSGDYERCIVIDNRRYGHVLNPLTGWPVNYLAAVTVVADFCVVAGSASTIAMLKEQQGPVWLEKLGLPHLWVSVAGEPGGSLLQGNDQQNDAEHGQ